MKKALKIVLSFILAAVLLFFAFRGIDWSAFWSGLLQTDWRWMVAYLVVAVLALVFREMRWRGMLLPFGPVRRLDVWDSINVGNVVNVVLPGAGEFVRCGYVSKRGRVGYDKSLGTIVSERLWDFLAVGIVFVLALSFAGKRVRNFFRESVVGPLSQRFGSVGIWLVVLGAIAILVLIFVIIWRCRERSRFCGKVASVLKGVIDGFSSFMKIRRKGLFSLYTVGIWLMYTLMTYFALRAVPSLSGLSFVDALFISGLGNIASVIPVPGGIGAYHYLIALTLQSVYGVEWQTGLLFATLSHEAHAVVILLLGLVSYVRLSVKKNNTCLMKKLSVTLLLCLPVLWACNKTDDPAKDQVVCFTFNDNGYPTLQSAVDAVAALNPEGTATIVLTADATGKGAVLPKGAELDIVLNVGEFTYSVKSGYTINATNNSLTLTGNGGELRSLGDDPVLKVSGGTLLTIAGDISISGETAVSTCSPVIVDENYSGEISGEIYLQEAPFQVYSPNCEVFVPILTAVGEGSVFSVDAIGERKYDTPVAIVGQVISDRERPVTTCMDEDVIVNYGDKHIHTFKTASYPGSCIIQGAEYQECTECGYVRAEGYSQTDFGKCDPASLVRHPAVEPVENKFGNIEYYECPFCGRYYLDAQGTMEAKDGILLVPTNFDYLDKLMDTEIEPWTFPPFDVASLLITNAMTAGFFVKALLDQIEMQRQFKESVEKLKQISAKLDDIKIRMTGLLKSIELIPYKIKMSDRMDRFNLLQVETITSLVAVDSVVRFRPDLTKAQKEVLINKILVDWSGTASLEKSIHPQEEIFSLMKEATTNSTGPNIPQMYSEIMASHPNVLWEHQTYDAAVAMLTYDVGVVTALVWCSGFFNESIRQYSSPDAKKAYKKLMSETYREYSKAMTDEYKRLAHRDSVYRRYMPSNVTYHRILDTDYDIYGYFANRNEKCWFPRANDNHDAQKYCYEVMDFKKSDQSKYGARSRSLSFMQTSDANDMYQKSVAMAKARGEKTDFTAYDLIKKARFTGYPDKNWKLILDRDRSWGLDKSNDYEFPHCWIFYWRSYKGSYGHDYFGIRTVMKNDGGTEEVKVVKSCNVEVPSGKMTKINRNDDVKDYKYSTIVVAGTGDKVSTKK